MKKYFICWLLLAASAGFSFSGDNSSFSLQRRFPERPVEKDQVYRVNAESAKINSTSTEIVTDNRLSSKKGITLKAGVPAALDGERTEPDIIFNIKAPEAGRYVINTYAVTDTEGAAAMKKAKTKFESLYIKIQFDSRRPTKRVVYVPWDISKQESGKFDLTGGEQQMKIWLPRGVRLEYVEFLPYVAPAVPVQALNYKPTVLPPAQHPRLWVNQQSLPLVRSRVQIGENKEAWEKVKKTALTPFEFKFDPAVEMSFNPGLETAAEAKAFYYLITGDKKIGKEAIQLTADYLSHVEFGNLLDITREMGRAINSASEVYDWCYDLMTPSEKKILYTNLMRLADDMEAGWPPFKQSVVNGHGNEAQICRDLLSMSIAVYNEDPLPYQYTSYVILEDLVPLRKFEYQSPRHNQGVNYGSYRFGWDMHAAWLLYRMSGKPVFDDNIKDMRYFWQYMRVPDGQMLRDGDGFSAGAPGEFYYWKAAQTMFLNYAYANDPLIKAEFERQGGIPNTPVLFLLLNDPGLKADPSTDSMPLTKDFGKVLGSMIARTGWNIGLNSNDVVAEIKGGGYLFGNHQHADAGSLQLYYRGFQFGDLGVYKFYGTPYDMGFNKRSVAHSMMLALNPEAKAGDPDDGGTRPNRRFPKTAEEVQADPGFNNGRVVSADFGPSAIKPAFSYFAADLTGAYSSKMDAYTRGFCFLNLDRQDIPAAIILTDDMTTESAEVSKYWQINALNQPEQTKDGVILQNQRGGLVGKTHVQMLVPQAADRKVEILSGPDANSSFTKKYDAPEMNQPEITGHRILFSSATPAARNRFLTVFQVTAGDTKPLPVQHYETPVSYVIILADRVVSMSNSAGLISKSFNLKVPESGNYQVVLTGMKAGKWIVKSANGKVNLKAEVADGKNTIFFKGVGGQYTITPGS